MSTPIRIGIVGYGNLGRGVEAALQFNPDLKLQAIFTRRQPETVEADSKMVHISEVEKYKDQIDVMILCGGSATDLPEQGPQLAEMFHTVDSFDTHARIPEYFAQIDAAAQKSGKVSVISTGWDPGLFSLNRLLMEAILPQGTGQTFWGRGVSQGHSDAVRRVAGVKHAVQYTIPQEEAIESVRRGENPILTTRDKHLRDCYVVPEEGADTARIAEEIKSMPNYFADYETNVTFITEAELQANHAQMPHGGFVLRSGKSGGGHTHVMEFGIKLDNNPEFTSSVLVAYARAAYKLGADGQKGAKTVYDIPFGALSPKSAADLRRELL